MEILCQCGCGKALPPRHKENNHPALFLRGHHRRMFARYTPTPEEIPSGFCECGCGQRTPLVTRNNRRLRRFVGYPNPRMPGHGSKDGFCKGEQNVHWKGGKRFSSEGYVLIRMPDHPNANSGGYVLEHRLVMSQTLGRTLHKFEQVHHINGNKQDNRPENLELWNRSQPSGVRAKDFHCSGCRCFDHK